MFAIARNLLFPMLFLLWTAFADAQPARMTWPDAVAQ
jgi:hypothetical protein